MNFIPTVGLAKTIKSINIRKGAPSTGAMIIKTAALGETLPFIGWVTDGENVSGNSTWFKTPDGNYFWSGNVNVIENRSGFAKTIKGMNVRKGKASTLAAIVTVIPAEQIIPFVDWIDNGESVQGNTKWFKTAEGNYFWSGNVQVVAGNQPPSNEYVPITSAQLASIVILPAAKITEYTNALNQAMQEFSINSPLCKAAFIAQTAHESIGYKAFIENLNYSAPALLKTWPTRFTVQSAALYAFQPAKIANHVYANRNGNGTEASGDGYRYRGRGIIQITFKDNYKACGTGLNLDLVATPQLLEQSLHAFRSGAWYWKSRNLNELADKGDFNGVTIKINGGLNGLADRLRYYGLAKKALGIG